MSILLNASDLAIRLKISKPFAYRLIHTGAIPSVRIGRCVRVREQDLDTYIQRQVWPDISKPVGRNMTLYFGNLLEKSYSKVAKHRIVFLHVDQRFI